MPIVIYGDSIAVNLAKCLPSSVSYAKTFTNIADVLSVIQSYPLSLANTRVILSTGVLATYDAQLIRSDSIVLDFAIIGILRDQIRALRARWAAVNEIRVLGTGRPNLDAQLTSIYFSLATILVPVAPEWIGFDGIHPQANYLEQIALIAAS